MTAPPIYKIVPREAWRAAPDPWPGNADDLRDGYVHLSAGHQVQGTLRKWFAPARDDLLLLVVEPARLPSGALRWEANKPGGDAYPHLYAPLPHHAVVAVHALPWDGDAYRVPASPSASA